MPILSVRMPEIGDKKNVVPMVNDPTKAETKTRPFSTISHNFQQLRQVWKRFDSSMELPLFKLHLIQFFFILFFLSNNTKTYILSSSLFIYLKLFFCTHTRVVIPFIGNTIRKKQDTERSQKGVVYIYIYNRIFE